MRHQATSRGVIKRMRLSIHSPYVALDFSDSKAAKPAIIHDAFSGMKFVVAFALLMKYVLKKSFQMAKSTSSVSIDNGPEVVWY